MLTVSIKIDQHDFHGLLYSAELVEAELRLQLAPLGILPLQARVLESLGRAGPVSQSELALAFGITCASMSTMTDRLLAAGYITRAVDPPSRRRNLLELTNHGRTLLVGLDDAWAAVDDKIRNLLGNQAEVFFRSGPTPARGSGWHRSRFGPVSIRGTQTGSKSPGRFDSFTA